MYRESPDEIIQIILNELNDPTSFSLLSKKFHSFTQDPYVRASYFLARYGRIQALYWALGRGKLMNEKVLDVCIPPLALHAATPIGQLTPLCAILDPFVQWRPPLSLPSPMCNTPLLPHPGTIH